jgi:hypothetical protein
MKRMEWYDTGMGNPIARIFDDDRIDLSDSDNKVRTHYFDGTYVNYAVGSTISWGPGAAEDSCGFYLRGNSDSSHKYFARIDQNGYLTLSEVSGSEWTQIDDTQLANLNTGRGASNTMMVMVLRDYFYVFVNGQYVMKASDGTDKDAATSTGLTAGTYELSGTTYCDFYNAWVWPIDDWEWN